MKVFLPAVAITAIAIALCANQASAAKLCKLTGSYTDSDHLTTSVTIKGKSGSLTAPAACATPYTFKITNETVTGFTVTGKNKTTSCGTFSAMPMFEGSCSVFGGTVTIHGFAISDTFTKTTPARPAPSTAAPMTDGLK